MARKRNHIILFDGVCNLCNASVQFIIKHDKKALFSFASLQSAEGQSLLEQYNLPLVNFSSFVYIENGKAYQRSDAALHIAGKMSGGWPALYLFTIIPRPLRDFIYKKIADNRYRLMGKRDSCIIPTPELRERFL